MNVKDRCSDCICLADDSGVWTCDECSKACDKVITCPEGLDDLDTSYTIDDNGTMTIYVNGCSVADISDCKKLDDIQLQALVMEVLADLGYEV